MKKFVQKWFLFTCLSFAFAGVNGQLFTAVYDFADFKNNSGKTDPTPPPVVEGIGFGSFSASAAVSAQSTAGGRFSFTNWDLGAVNGSDVFTGSLNSAKYYEVTLTAEANYLVNLDSISFTLQRSGTGIRQYSVRSSVDAYATNLPAIIRPSSGNLSVVDDNVFQVSDATTNANNGSKILLSAAAFKNVSGSVTFRFYGFNAEQAGGSFSIDNVTFYGTSTLSPTAPNIVLSESTMVFPATDIHGGESVRSYTITGANLTDPVSISVAAPFSLSESVAGPYTQSLLIAPGETAGGKTIHVKFIPGITGTFQEAISHTSTGALPRTLLLSGDGVDPLNLSFSFDDCTPLDLPGSGFLAYSVTGSQVWACSQFGRNGTNGVDINGYSGGAQTNEDWLISPALNVSVLNLPILEFWSRGEFSGAALQLLVSTDYDGSGNPNNFTWTPLNGQFPALTNTWKHTDGIDLSAYKSATGFYIAFKYESSEAIGASRWTIDDIRISDRSFLLTVVPPFINFQEVSSGSQSAPVVVSVRAVGYGDLTIYAPMGYEVSADGTSYSSSTTMAEAVSEAGTSVWVRFAPSTKELRITGEMEFVGTGLDSLALEVTGSSYPKSETFDAGAYNLSFFGSNPTNNPTPQKIATQVNNIATVLNTLNLDIVGFEEMSNDDALDSLLVRLPNHAAIVSPRWAYSYNAPDPAFPLQKIGFIYDTTTMKLVSSRAMFTDLYDQARTTTPGLIPGYPSGNPSSFWASGRLPFLATFDVTIGLTTKRIHVIDVHGKAGADQQGFNRRQYDMQVLKDTLDMYFSGQNVIILGDYNDRMYRSIYTGSPVSPFQSLATDSRYSPLTLPLDVEGATSFIGGSGLIDHITISSALNPDYIATSTEIFDPRPLIPGYDATTASDHLPIFSRFDLTTALPVTLMSFNAERKGDKVRLSWTVTNEINNAYFTVEKSTDGRNFHAIQTVPSKSGSLLNHYEALDSKPVKGINYYRLKQTDRDGKSVYSSVTAVSFAQNLKDAIAVYPNPVENFVIISLPKPNRSYSGRLLNAEGKLIRQLSGNMYQINQQLNGATGFLTAGIYLIRLQDGNEQHSVRFLKK